MESHTQSHRAGELANQPLRRAISGPYNPIPTSAPGVPNRCEDSGKCATNADGNAAHSSCRKGAAGSPSPGRGLGHSAAHMANRAGSPASPGNKPHSTQEPSSCRPALFHTILQSLGRTDFLGTTSSVWDSGKAAGSERASRKRRGVSSRWQRPCQWKWSSGESPSWGTAGDGLK